MRSTPIVVFTLIALMGMSLAGCKVQQKAAAKPKDRPSQEAEGAQVPVSVTVAQPTDFDEFVEVTGTLQPTDRVTVGPRIGGRIVWIIGKEGTPVKRGEVVARMDDDDAKTQVRAARAGVQAAKARLEQAKAAVLQQATATDSGIANAEAGLLAATARLKQARVTADAQDATANAQVKSAEAVLDSARSRLAVLRNGARAQERVIAENAVAVAKATYDNDVTNYERVKNLYDQGAIAKATMDNAETRMRVSKAQYDSVLQSLSLVQTGARAEDIQAAEAAVRQAEEGVATARANLKQNDVARANVEISETGVTQAKTALESAKSAKQVNVMRDKDVLAAQAALEQAKDSLTFALQGLDNTQVYSPVDGVVAERTAEVGQSVGSNAEVLTLATNQSLYFEANVSELEATRLRNGQPVVISVDALQGDRSNLYARQSSSTITGTVEKVVPVVDARTRNFTVRVVVARSAALYPGMFARGKVIVAKHQQVIAVAKDALVEKNGRQYVFVVTGSTAQERPVAVGAGAGNLVQILSGLAAGDQVVTVGQQSLLDGDKVIVTRPAGK